ncbi:MAG: 1-deoxy-D-xylulose-5-phosphate synthase, partial [Clostridia bacterium]|nr:1-deoxy-D-xylulose-5-phosphate synthase [Clostridia bacterium]
MLEKINSPQDLKALSLEQLEGLAAEIRALLVSTVLRQGGHLASNLGAVELTLALDYVFNPPDDKLVFDVGHQAYVHKILTGRREAFAHLREQGGLSGFPRISESEYDAFSAGHASTAISAALGMARARDLMGDRHAVVAVVGDGALTGGMCYEALNDAGS